MSNLTFTEKEHEYRVDGVVVPSVTQVLEASGLSDVSMIPKDLLERASAFGKAAHKAIELYSKGTLDMESVDAALMPYIDGWKAFTEDYGYSPRMMEFRGYSPLYRFGFTIDQLGSFNGKAIHMGDVLVDIKTGHPAPAHKYQMGGYKIAAGKEYRNIVLLYLNPEFKPRGYKVIFSNNNRRDQSVFLAALTLYNVRKQEGIL